MKWDTCKKCVWRGRKACVAFETSCSRIRAEAEEEVARLKNIIDNLYNAYSNDRDPMRADTIGKIYAQKDMSQR